MISKFSNCVLCSIMTLPSGLDITGYFLPLLFCHTDHVSKTVGHP